MLDRIRHRIAAAIAPGKTMSNTGGVLVRAGANPMAHLTHGHLDPRRVNPWLWEAIREVVPIIDGGIQRIITLDGILQIEGDNDRLVAEIEEWAATVPVNDAEQGLQAMYASMGDEQYEQGFALAEWIPAANGRDIDGLRVADSKGVLLRRQEDGSLAAFYRPPVAATTLRRDGTDQVESVLRNRFTGSVQSLVSEYGFTPLDRDRLIYSAHDPEAGNPYGVSVMRSMEFVVRVLLTIQNAMSNSWDRYGDPPLMLTLQVADHVVAKNSEEMGKRQKLLAENLQAVLNAKRTGNAADFVNAIGKDDVIKLDIIGAQGEALEIEAPARHTMEQIVAKLGLPSWMVGLQWSTAERMSQQQSEVVLMEARTRFERRRPGLRRLIETLLRLRGRTWRAGDWRIVQRLPNLHDELARAQAQFLQAQTAMMLGRSAEGGVLPPGVDTDAGKALRKRLRAAGMDTAWLDAMAAPNPVHDVSRGPRGKGSPPHDVSRGTLAKVSPPRASSDMALLRIEVSTTGRLLQLWRALRGEVLAVVGLSPADLAAAGTNSAWRLDETRITDLVRIGEQFAARAGGDEGVLPEGMDESLLRGVGLAREELEAAGLQLRAAIDDTLDLYRAALRERAFDLVRNVTARALEDDIIAELASHQLDGRNPREVARILSNRFDVHEYDWERLARSEIALAQVRGKEAQYLAEGIREYDYVTVGDDKVSPICAAHESNNPHPVGSGPLPMQDSHPNCRCTVVPRVPEA